MGIAALMVKRRNRLIKTFSTNINKYDSHSTALQKCNSIVSQNLKFETVTKILWKCQQQTIEKKTWC